MSSIQDHVTQYKKLCEEFYTIHSQLASLRNVAESIDAGRFQQQESEYQNKLDQIEPQINELAEIISKAISGQETSFQQMSAKINTLENKIGQEDILLEAGAISKDRYENIVAPLKNELAQLKLKAGNITDRITYLKSALDSCTEEKIFSSANEFVVEIDAEKVSKEERAIQSKAPATGIYLSYLMGLLIWFIPIIGVVFAYVFQGNADEVLQSHYRFQIRTFWIWFLFGMIVIILMTVVIGFFLAPVLLIWLLVRCIVGLKYLYEGKPVPNPKSWLLGT